MYSKWLDEDNEEIDISEETLQSLKDQLKDVQGKLSSHSEAQSAKSDTLEEKEKRLKALLDLEKSNAHAKQDLLAAQRAERQRKQAVSDHKRALRREEMLEQEALLSGLLREKLAIKEPKYPGTFSSFDDREPI